MNKVTCFFGDHLIVITLGSMGCHRGFYLKMLQGGPRARVMSRVKPLHFTKGVNNPQANPLISAFYRGLCSWQEPTLYGAFIHKSINHTSDMTSTISHEKPFDLHVRCLEKVKDILPNGCLLVMNPTVESVKNHPTQTNPSLPSIHFQWPC